MAKQTNKTRKKEEDCYCALQNNQPKNKAKRHFFNSIIIIPLLLNPSRTPPFPPSCLIVTIMAF